MEDFMKPAEIDPLIEIPDDDPIVQQIIEASIAPFRHRVTPELLADMRDVLVLFLTSHPEASRTVDGLRPRAGRVISGQVVRETSAAEAEPTKKGRASGGER
jgi:hypothetical protein